MQLFKKELDNNQIRILKFKSHPSYSILFHIFSKNSLSQTAKRTSVF